MSFGPYAYSNNGLSMRSVAEDYQPVAGEVIFADPPTTQQLTAAFPGYAAAAAVVQAAIDANAALLAGINLTSSGTPGLNGTYNIGTESQANVAAVTTYILLNDKFPGGQTSMPWVDKNGDAHVFGDVATFKAFATAMADYVAAVSLYGDSGGQHGSLPSPNISII